jgi:hypothetical protein
MKKRRPLFIASILLILAIGTYSRISGNENIRTVQFLSIFVIGMLSGVIIRDVIVLVRSDKSN